MLALIHSSTFFSENPKTRLFTFLKFHVKKRKNVESVVQVFTFLHFEIADKHFRCKLLHTSCYTYNIILRLFIFWLKYNGLGIVPKATKLIEGGYHGLQDYRHICCYFYVFFQNPNSRDFLRFCRVRTFSRTMPY